jgi:hypothetical protein
MLSENEVEHLNRVSEVITSHVPVTDMAAAIDQIHDEITSQPTASPAAIAIVAIAADSIRNAVLLRQGPHDNEQPDSAVDNPGPTNFGFGGGNPGPGSKEQRVFAGDVLGGAFGAAVGGAVGYSIGGPVGGVVGVIVGAVATGATISGQIQIAT